MDTIFLILCGIALFATFVGDFVQRRPNRGSKL